MQVAVVRQSENEENTVIRRLSTFVLTLVALVSFVNVGHAQQPLMTRHTREEVASRAVPLVGNFHANEAAFKLDTAPLPRFVRDGSSASGESAGEPGTTQRDHVILVISTG